MCAVHFDQFIIFCARACAERVRSRDACVRNCEVKCMCVMCVCYCGVQFMLCNVRLRGGKNRHTIYPRARTYTISRILLQFLINLLIALNGCMCVVSGIGATRANSQSQKCNALSVCARVHAFAQNPIYAPHSEFHVKRIRHNSPATPAIANRHTSYK